jgi:hypothetical protein
MPAQAVGSLLRRREVKRIFLFFLSESQHKPGQQPDLFVVDVPQELPGHTRGTHGAGHEI